MVRTAALVLVIVNVILAMVYLWVVDSRPGNPDVVRLPETPPLVLTREAIDEHPQGTGTLSSGGGMPTELKEESKEQAEPLSEPDGGPVLAAEPAAVAAEIQTATPDPVNEVATEPLMEVGVAEDPEPAREPAAEPAMAGAQSQCYSVGPFSNEDQYDAAQALLERLGVTPSRRSAAGEIWIGHWLYLPNVSNQSEANVLVRRLAEAGFEDTYFDPTGADGNVLSLGLYRERARVEALRDRIEAAGFEPVLVDRTRSATVYWADFEHSEQLQPDLLSSLQGANRVVGVQLGHCDVTGSAAG